MKILKEKYFKLLSFNKDNKSNDSNVTYNNKRKISIVSTLDTQNTRKKKSKPNSLEISNKEFEMMKNYRLKKTTLKEIPSFKGSSLPIFLSSMTNSKNNLPFITHKFKLIKGSNSNNNKSINQSSLINNSNINNKIDLERNFFIQNKDILKKLDLKINFPKSKNIFNLKYASTRNLLNNQLNNTIEDKTINLKRYINTNKSINNNQINYSNNNSKVNNNYKNHNISMDNNLEKYYLLNQKMNVFKNQSKRKLKNALYKKINEEIATINDENKNKNEFDDSQMKQKKIQSTKKIIHNVMKNTKTYEKKKKTEIIYNNKRN